eukprot:7136887-Pyramimonas_sp.AAC.1
MPDTKSEPAGGGIPNTVVFDAVGRPGDTVTVVATKTTFCESRACSAYVPASESIRQTRHFKGQPIASALQETLKETPLSA